MERFSPSDGLAEWSTDPATTEDDGRLPAPAPKSLPGERFPPGTVLAGRYRIASVVGRGAMGEVYRADDLKLELPVALKFLAERLESDRRRLSFLLNEVKVARQVAHPNVCRVYDLGEVDGRPFISMEYVDGEDLRTLLRRIGRLASDKAVEVACQVCHGLAAAHEVGVLHRDLKPSNLMIDGAGQARLTDFGVAISVSADAGPVGGRAGTTAYMAPERLAGRAPTVEADLYALGLVLYELFTGRRAFGGRSGKELHRWHREVSPEPPSALVGSVAAHVERVILRCLEKDPARRPASASEVAAALAGDLRAEGRDWRPAPGAEIPHRRHWRIESKLGEGGFGEVWLADHPKTGERRVFKLCYDEPRLKALQREITLFRLLKEELGERDDIARIFDWNFDEPPYFIEAEYTAGGNLLEWAEARGGIARVPLAERLDIVAQVATALAAAHSVGVLHKDVKPANVLMTRDPEGRARAQLTDFGIATVTEMERLEAARITVLGWTEETGDASRTGTRLYMAPEQLEGRTATVQADVYALGVMLYQMVVGDLQRALAPGWEREVGDELLRADVAAAVDGLPEKRLSSASLLAERLRGLESRHVALAAERRRREEAERLRELAAASRRRRRTMAWTLAVLIVLTAVSTGMLYRVEREAARANREAETSRQVTDLLEKIFQVSDPDEALGSHVTAREILAWGSRRIDRELTGQPEVRARLLSTMAKAHQSLGLFDDAVALFERALAVQEGLHGPRHAEVAGVLDALANAVREKGDYERAAELGEKALAIRRALLGEGHPAVAASLDTLALVESEKNNPREAQELFRRSLEIKKKVLGNDHLEVAKTLTGLAESLMVTEDFGQAETLLRDVLALRRARLGDEHTEVAAALHGLATSLYLRGEYDQAETSFNEALEMRRRLLGDVHPDVADSFNNLGLLRHVKGDLEGAEEYFQRSIRINRRLRGDEHPYVAAGLGYLANISWEKGDLEAAETLFFESLEIYREDRGEKHLEVVNCLYNLARLTQARGDYERAEGYYRQSLDLARQLLPAKDPYLVLLLADLGWLLVETGDLEAVAAVFEGELDEIRERLPADHWLALNAASVRAAYTAKLGHPREAEGVLVSSFLGLREQLGDREYHTREALRRVVRLYEDLGEREKADRFRTGE